QVEDEELLVAAFEQTPPTAQPWVSGGTMAPTSVTRLGLSALLVGTMRSAEDKPSIIPPLPASTAKEAVLVPPHIPHSEFKLGPIKIEPAPLLGYPVEVADYTFEVVARLGRAADEVQRVEIWSLDPSGLPNETADGENRLNVFHRRRSLGHKELRDQEAIQK